MFDNLSNRLEAIYKKLKGRGKLKEADVDQALREIREETGLTGGQVRFESLEYPEALESFWKLG